MQARADLLAAGSAHGKTRNVARSGFRYMSDSSMRTNPSIDEPSNMILAVERLVELPVGDLDVLDDPEDVGELQPHELDPLLFRPRQNRLLQIGHSRNSIGVPA